MSCDACDEITPLCSACFQRRSAELAEMVAARGIEWAERHVHRAKTVGREPRWPQYDGRTRALALARVADLSADPRLVDHLAARCYDAATRRFVELRSR